jgi:hypothetical protein
MAERVFSGIPRFSIGSTFADRRALHDSGYTRLCSGRCNRFVKRRTLKTLATYIARSVKKAAAHTTLSITKDA